LIVSLEAAIQDANGAIRARHLMLLRRRKASMGQLISILASLLRAADVAAGQTEVAGDRVGAYRLRRFRISIDRRLDRFLLEEAELAAEIAAIEAIPRPTFRAILGGRLAGQ
jgi:hypothetical protein